MLYAILAYHVEEDVASWTPQQDAALMQGLPKREAATYGSPAFAGTTLRLCVRATRRANQ